MRLMLAAMSTALAIIAQRQRNHLLMAYWMLVGFYWLMNCVKGRMGK